MKTIAIAVAMCVALAGCAAEDWNGFRGGNQAAAMMMLSGGLGGYSQAQGYRAQQAQAAMVPTTCRPVNMQFPNGGFTCY